MKQGVKKWSDSSLVCVYLFFEGVKKWGDSSLVRVYLFFEDRNHISFFYSEENFRFSKHGLKINSSELEIDSLIHFMTVSLRFLIVFKISLKLNSAVEGNLNVFQ